MMTESTALKGVFIIHNFNATDERGIFVKTFNKNSFDQNHINFVPRESYFSVSKKNVIRGMHFQLPPHDHEKLVYVAQGSIIDVVLDLRKNSHSFGNHISVELSADNKKSIFIPKGLAHGFKSLEDNTITIYNVGTEYDSKSDSGIKFDSFGFEWGCNDPILSQRDQSFRGFEYFRNNNPFYNT
jgi:dTDP-4-dehydrorhamnose 3,5-epimerase